MSNYIDETAREIYWINDPDEIPSDEDMALYRIYAVLAFAKGETTTDEDVHDAWAAWRAETKPDHHSLIPFEQLSSDVQRLDDPYVEAIHEVARRRRREGR